MRQGKICKKLRFCAKRRNSRKFCAPQDHDFLQGLHSINSFKYIVTIEIYGIPKISLDRLKLENSNFVEWFAL